MRFPDGIIFVSYDFTLTGNFILLLGISIVACMRCNVGSPIMKGLSPSNMSDIIVSFFFSVSKNGERHFYREFILDLRSILTERMIGLHWGSFLVSSDFSVFG